MVSQQIIDKPGTEVSVDSPIKVKSRSPYVSRGGEKLAKALQEFSINVNHRICLDGGISTGGFTDCLLKNGAEKVYGVDVGYGQVAWSLRQDSRVILKERTNLRYLASEDLYQSGKPDADLGVVDVSFISLKKILPTMWALLAPPRDVIALIKPQFEVGREKVSKKGVVRDVNEHVTAIAQVLIASQDLKWHFADITWSPLVGPAGNIEYLLWLSMESSTPTPDRESLYEMAKNAKQTLS